jgi:hypothetical protein
MAERKNTAKFQVVQFENELPKHEVGLEKMFGSLSIIEENSCLCLPPLDVVTACSDDDAASYVSSISSNAEDFDMPVRSLFPSYWNKNSSKSSIPTVTDRLGHKRKLSKEMSSFETFEHSLNLSLLIEEDKSLASCNRRKIFGASGGYSFSNSEPHLASAGLESDTVFRKSQSLSAIYSQPQSCLRRGRYSCSLNDNQSLSDSSSSSVRFKQGVEVVFFQRPIEQHAQTGWSKFFV